MKRGKLGRGLETGGDSPCGRGASEPVGLTASLSEDFGSSKNVGHYGGALVVTYLTFTE
jgi:hypothetical protein